MAETQTPQEAQHNFDRQTDEALEIANQPTEREQFEDDLYMRGIDASRRQIQDADPRKTVRDNWKELSPKEKRTAGIALGAAGATVLAGAITGPEIVDRLDGPEFSEQTTTFIVQPGDDWYTIAESIPGHEAVDTRDIIDHIKADPANIDFLTNSDLHPGQSIVIPVNIEK